MESYAVRDYERRRRRETSNVEKKAMEVADDAWAWLPPELLLHIFWRLESTAVIRCAGTCKPWRRTIIGNALCLHPRPDSFNPNLLLGFFHEGINSTVSVTAVHPGRSGRLSSLMPGVDQSSSSQWISSSRDGWLLLLLNRKSWYSYDEELCLCYPMAGDCTFLPRPSIREHCEYTLITSNEGTGDRHGAASVRILAMEDTMCTHKDMLTYQIISCGAETWSAVQHSEDVNKGLRIFTNGNNANTSVVAGDAVYWFAGPWNSRSRMTCTVGLDICTGHAWVTELPNECQCSYSMIAPCALATSANGRLSLLQLLPEPDRYMQVWALGGNGDIDAIEWTVQYKISVSVPNLRGGHQSKVICPRSGFMFIIVSNKLQLRVDLDSHSSQPVERIGKVGRRYHYPYEMDWSTYISRMKNF